MIHGLRRVATTLAVLALAVLAAAGCTGAADGGSNAGADSLTRRQRDSLLGESPVPGASGVRGALDAADRARERAGRVDSTGDRQDR